MAEHRKVQLADRSADTEQVGTRRRREAEDVLRMAQHRRSMQALNRAAETAAALAEAHSAAVADTDPEGGGRQDDPADAAGSSAAAVAAPAENVRSLNAARAKRHRHPAGSGRA
jgi:hypothetical protein